MNIGYNTTWMRWEGMGLDGGGMGWDGIGHDGMEWDGDGMDEMAVLADSSTHKVSHLILSHIQEQGWPGLVR